MLTHRESSSLLHCQTGPCFNYIVDSPIGNLTVTSCQRGLHAVMQEDGTESGDPKPSVPVTMLVTDENSACPVSPAALCVSWLKAYFEEPENICAIEKPPLCPAACARNGAFIEQVWLGLQEKVPFGSTTTYAGLAELVGRPRAAMAVGSAMRRNPFHLLVPCHRVVKAGGGTGHYCGGKRNDVKRWLLDHEQKFKQMSV